MQSFTSIQSSQSLQSSLALIMNNDRTALSCSAGSAFPTTSLQQGQLCWRIDQKKLYLLADSTPTWALLVDLSSGNRASVAELLNNALVHRLSGNDGGSIMLEKAESGTTLAGNLSIKLKGDQLQFFDAGNNKGFYLDMSKGAASIAQKIWHSGNQGQGSGLDADTLRTKIPGNEVGNVSLNNGTLNKTLNAELLNGHDSTYYAPINNPLFTGFAQGQTPTQGDNSVKFATTAFVQTAVSLVDLGSRLSLGGGTLTGDLRIATGHLQIYGHAGNANMSVLYLNLNGDRYLHYDGANYNLPGAQLYVAGGMVWHSNNIGTPINGEYGVWMGANQVGNCGIFANDEGIETFRAGNVLGSRRYIVNCHDCNCDSSGSGCCFPQGSLVLMADGSKKDVVDIKPGDWVQGPTEAWEVDHLYVTTLGADRDLMTFAEDRSLFWSAEHPLWSKLGERQWFWLADLGAFKREVEEGITVGLFDNDSFLTGDVDVRFAHLDDIWRERTPIPVLADQHMKLYLPIPKPGSGSDRMAFIDGYLVSTSANQWDRDYIQFSWGDHLAAKIKERK